MELPRDWSEFIGRAAWWRASGSTRDRFLGRRELVANKLASGLPKDLADVALLEEGDG